MSNNEKEIRAWFSKFNNEEFRQLLEEVGFEVEDGDGKIIFSEVVFEGMVNEYLDDNGNKSYEVINKDKTTYDGNDFEYDLSELKNEKVRITIESIE